MPGWLRYLLFLSVVIAVYGGAHYYVYRRFLTALGPLPPTWLWATRIFLIAMVAGFFLMRFLRGGSHNGVVVALHWLLVLWVGFIFYVFLLALAAHLVAVVTDLSGFGEWSLAGLRPGEVAVIAVLAGALVASVCAFHTARGTPETTELVIPVKRLPDELNGFSIVQVSDLHLGLVNGQARLRRIVEHVNALDPDLIVIPGDLGDEDAADLDGTTPLLSNLRARHGVLAVTGNHDYYAGVEEVVRRGEEAGVRYLRNAHVDVAGGLLVYGIEDPTAERMGTPRPKLEDVVGPEARTKPAILLCHQPVGLDEARALGIDLMLSGHTHRGQLWPFHLFVRLFHDRISGLYEDGPCRLYVSRGVGTWGPPMRLGSAPEVVRIRLRAAPGAAEGSNVP